MSTVVTHKDLLLLLLHSRSPCVDYPVVPKVAGPLSPLCWQKLGLLLHSICPSQGQQCSISPFLFPPWKNPAWVSTPAFTQLQPSAMQARTQKFPPSSALPLLTHFQSGLFLEEDPDTPIYPGGTHFSYDSQKMEKYYLKNCIGSVSVIIEMRHPGAKTPSSICGGKGDPLVSQFSLNSLPRQCFCELENLTKVSPLLCYSRKLPHFLDGA